MLMKSIIDRIVHSLYPDECTDKESSKIYKIHKYWARKPWYIVEKYIENYSEPNDTVMDPFCGSGLTGLEAAINGRNFIGQDINPTAIRVSFGTIINDFDLDSFADDFEKISAQCKKKIMSFYQSDYICPSCGQQMYYKHCSIGPKFSSITGSLFCTCGHKEKQHVLSASDISHAESFNSMDIHEWYPKTPFPKRFYKDRFSYKGILTVADMYTKRNLYALALILDAIEKVNPANKPFFYLAFTNTVLHVSKLKGENVRPLSVNNYWVPDDYIEENVWFRFEDRVHLIKVAKETQKKRTQKKQAAGLTYGEWCVKKKSALKEMGNNSIDYIFTDPPYGDAIQYSELSFIWNAWMKENYETDEEVIINPVQGKGFAEYNDLLCKSLDNVYVALKDGKYFTLCFQNKNSAIWKAVISHCKQLGLQLVDISIYNTYGFPFNKSWANFSPKSDIYVTFKKTDKSLFPFYSKNESVSEIIIEIAQYMQREGISADNNKLYDLTICYLIWAMFLNKKDIDVSNFDIKKFKEIAKGAVDYQQLRLKM